MLLGLPQLIPEAWQPAALLPSVSFALQHRRQYHRAGGCSASYDAHQWVQAAAGASCLL